MTMTELTTGSSLDAVADLAAQLRVDSVRSSTSAGSGHPTSSMSAADLLAVLPDLQIGLLEVLVDLVLVVAAHDLGEVAGRGVFEEIAELSVDFRLHVA